MPITVSSSLLRSIVEGAPTSAAEALTRFVTQNVRGPLHAIGPETRVPMQLVNQAWELAAAASRNDAVALTVAAQVPTGCFGAVEYLAASQRNVGEAVESFCRATSLMHDLTACSLRRDAGAWTFEQAVRWPTKELSAHGTIQLFALLKRVGSRLAGRDLAFDDIYLSIPEPQRIDEFIRFFGPCRLHFGAARSLLVFAADPFTMPVDGHDAALHDVLSDYVRLRQLHDVSGCEWEDQVRRLLLTNARAITLSAEDLAERLGCSPRTLQRRLRDEGTSFDRVKAEVRELLGIERLEAGDSVEAVSERLGFADVSSFSRAFKGWTGRPPSAWRRRGRQP